MKYELDTMEDFILKLSELKVKEVGMKQKLFGADIILQPAKAGVPGQPAKDGAAEIPAQPVQPEIRGKQVTAVFTFTAVGLKKTLAEEFEIPITFQEALPPIILANEADGKAFDADLEAKAEEYRAMLLDANKDMQVLSGTILPSLHQPFFQALPK